VAAQSPPGPRWHIPAVLLAAAALTGLAWGIAQPDFLTHPDPAAFSPDYAPAVRSLLAGQGLPDARYPPLFPLLLAAAMLAANRLNIAPGLLTGLGMAASFGLSAALIYAIARRLWGARPALLAALAWMLYPPVWRWLLSPLSGLPFTMLLLGAALLLSADALDEKGWVLRSAGCGALLGLAMLTRPIGIGPAAVFPAALLLRPDRSFRRRLAQAGLALAGCLLAILPWQAWMAAQGETAFLSSGAAPSILDGLTYAVDPSENRPLRVPADVEQLQQDIYARQYGELDSAGSIAAYLVEQMGRRPGAVAKLFVIKAARAWYGTDSGTLDRALLAMQVPVMALLAGSAWRAQRAGGARRRMAAIFAGTTLTFWAMTTLVLSILRYMLPAISLLFTLIPALLPGAIPRSGPLSTPQPLTTAPPKR
jgi:4-amino-4-deoxy-L-arabinose transferase-like glycosyltransferase